MRPRALLVVARSSMLREQLAHWSSSLGFEVAVAAGSRPAMQLWHSLRPVATIIGDLKSFEGALRLARQMRHAEAASARPRAVLLAATGYGHDRPYDAFRSAGYDGVLGRPVTPDALRLRLAAAGLLYDAASDQARMQREEAERMFWHELEGDLRRLRHAVLHETTTDVARWAHRIKGASLMFGKEALGDVAARLETETGLGSHADATVLLALADQLQALSQGRGEGAAPGSEGSFGEGSAGDGNGAGSASP